MPDSREFAPEVKPADGRRRPQDRLAAFGLRMHPAEGERIEGEWIKIQGEHFVGRMQLFPQAPANVAMRGRLR